MSNASKRYPYWASQSTPNIQKEISKLESADESALGKSANRRRSAKINALKAIVRSRIGNNSNQQKSQSGGNSNNRTGKRNRKENSSVGRNTRLQDARVLHASSAAYLACVFDPATYKGVAPRVPTTFPFPSSTKTITFSGTAMTNATGSVQFVCQPQCGFTLTGPTLSYPLIAHSNHDSFTVANKWEQQGAVSPGQMWTYKHYWTDEIAETMIDKMRLVSACMQLRSDVKLADYSGEWHSALIPRGAMRGTQNAIAANNQAHNIYAGFDPEIIDDMQFSSVINATKTAEVIWVPRDDIDFDYMPYANLQNPNAPTMRHTSCLVIHGTNLPPNTAVRYKFFAHIEFIPTIINKLSVVDTTEPQPVVLSLAQAISNANPNYIASEAANNDNLAQVIEKKAELATSEKGVISSVGDALSGFVSTATEVVNNPLVQMGAHMMGLF